LHHFRAWSTHWQWGSVSQYQSLVNPLSTIAHLPRVSQTIDNKDQPHNIRSWSTHWQWGLVSPYQSSADLLNTTASHPHSDRSTIEIKDMFHYIRAQSTHSEWAAIMLNFSSAKLLNAMSLLDLIIFGQTVDNSIYIYTSYPTWCHIPFQYLTQYQQIDSSAEEL